MSPPRPNRVKHAPVAKIRQKYVCRPSMLSENLAVAVASAPTAEAGKMKLDCGPMQAALGPRSL